MFSSHSLTAVSKFSSISWEIKCPPQFFTQSYSHEISFQAGPHYQRCETRVSLPAEIFETRRGERFAGGLALIMRCQTPCWPLADSRCSRPRTFPRAKKRSCRSNDRAEATLVPKQRSCRSNARAETTLVPKQRSCRSTNNEGSLTSDTKLIETGPETFFVILTKVIEYFISLFLFFFCISQVILG